MGGRKKFKNARYESTKCFDFFKEYDIEPDTNPHFSRARAVQEQGISARRRSILYFEGRITQFLCRSGSPLVKNLSKKR